MPKSALGRGLGSLIPQQKTIQEDDYKSELNIPIFEVDVEMIVPNPRQPRQQFLASELEDLLQSIKEHGILMPLVVTKLAQDKYELIAGERRLRASKLLGLEKVPVIVREANEQEKLELALIENIQRQDLNALEEALAYDALMREFNLTQEQIAMRLGKNRSTVANILRLLDLPDFMQDALRDGKISKSHARTLLAENDLEKQKTLFERMMSGEVTVRAAEAVVQKKSNLLKRSHLSDPDLTDYVKRLREALGTKVILQGTRERGQIAIEFYSNEDLVNIVKCICHELN